MQIPNIKIEFPTTMYDKYVYVMYQLINLSKNKDKSKYALSYIIGLRWYVPKSWAFGVTSWMLMMAIVIIHLNI